MKRRSPIVTCAPILMCCFLGLFILFGGYWPVVSADAIPKQAAAQSSKSCSVSKTVMTEPTQVEGAGRFGYGAWYVNEDHSIWVRNDSWQAGKDGNKVLWKKPVGTMLVVTGRRLDGPAPQTRTGYRDTHFGFAVTGLYFDSPGCWQLIANAGSEHLDFVTEVLPESKRPYPATF
jgi:hypothetical protein